MILGISGKAGSGKDAAASVLAREYGFIRVAFADELKRVAAQLFGWDDDRLWGPSERRSEPDPAWGGLTARRALQVLGTEVGRRLHPDVWVRATMREVERLVRGDTREGTDPPRTTVRLLPASVVIPDVRFRNEAEAVKAAGGFLLRVVRPGAGLEGAAGEHASETELSDGDGLFDARIVNDGTLEEFDGQVAALGAVLVGRAPPGPPTLGPWQIEHNGVFREAEHPRDCGCRACSGST